MPAKRGSKWRYAAGWIGAAAALTGELRGQPAPPAVELTLRQAVESGLKNYPLIRISQEQINAAAAGIQLARTAYLPRIDLLAQANRATRNNVFGLLLPQSVIPSMSGPVLGINNLGTAWGSAVGALVTWEPFDFGERGWPPPWRSEPSPRPV
jgi:outer membrane protein